MTTYHKMNPLHLCEIKLEQDEPGTFSCYASSWGNADKVGDVMAKTAFDSALESKAMPRMFVNHDHSQVPVGDWISMEKDDTGLVMVGRIDLEHKDGPTVYSALKREAFGGTSIGFAMGPDDFENTKGGGRVIHNLDLREVSIVNYPCNTQAQIVAVKSDLMALESLKECERFLRGAEITSRSMASAFVSQVVKLSRGVRDEAEHTEEMQLKLALADALINLNRKFQK